jgi:hypothetical protein
LFRAPSGALAIQFTLASDLSLGGQENRYGLLRCFIKIKYIKILFFVFLPNEMSVAYADDELTG